MTKEGGGDYRSKKSPAPTDITGDRMLVLGLETSCDETAASVIRWRTDDSGEILSNIVLSQIDEHRAFGGVVPEIAARAHVTTLDRVVAAALDDAGIALDAVDGIAATAGPGLIGGLLVGLVTGKSLALAAGKPFIAVNHLEAHVLTATLTDGLKPPFLVLLVSGGHSELIAVKDIGCYEKLGATIDDAAGEAFDKAAKLLGLGYPGGPAVEQVARDGDPYRFALPRPLVGRDGADFSFAGLKTALRLEAERIAPLSDQDVADLCAGFQAAVTDCVVERTEHALALSPDMTALVAAGGVAANRAIRDGLKDLAGRHGLVFVAPPIALCGDNAAMIAWVGALRLARGRSDPLDSPAHPRWPIGEPTVAEGVT